MISIAKWCSDIACDRCAWQDIYHAGDNVDIKLFPVRGVASAPVFRQSSPANHELKSYTSIIAIDISLFFLYANTLYRCKISNKYEYAKSVLSDVFTLMYLRLDSINHTPIDSMALNGAMIQHAIKR